MFSKIRFSLVLALLTCLMTSVSVLAKGGFPFITITSITASGPDIKIIRVTDAALTTNFFAFANFYEDRIEAPAEPGNGYEITRYYIDGKREIAFDQLHYYPETGFVFYEGIINGESEYDGEWYTADPTIKFAFEAALVAQSQPVETLQESQPVAEAVAETPVRMPQNRPLFLAAVAAGLILTLTLAYRLRKPVTR